MALENNYRILAAAAHQPSCIEASPFPKHLARRLRNNLETHQIF
jgi:hypothetical protein